LARINENKPYELYEDLFGLLLKRAGQIAPGHNFRFKNDLYSMDATTIDLCLSLFPWAKFRKNKGGVKLNVAMNHRGNLPEFVSLSNANEHEMKAGREVNFPKGSIVAADRGYTDYKWYQTLTGKGIYFVVRLKSNAKIRVLERREVDRSNGVTSDQTIEFTGAVTSAKCPCKLRRVGFYDEVTGRHYVFLTNNFKLAASTIARIYKSRWDIELFFKWIKQNLKIKSFYGTSRNAVLTQIWIAMCAYLLIALLKFQSKVDLSMQKIFRLLQLNLFEKWHLKDLLDQDKHCKPNINDYQPSLF
jgi:putative transposase